MSTEIVWLDRVLARGPGYESELVVRYSSRLLALAQSRLPASVRRRVDAEDVLQSVFRSFFRRMDEGQFDFEETHDIWLLLAAMTFRKVHNAVKFQKRQQRDVGRDVPLRSSQESNLVWEPTDPAPRPDDLVIFVECLDALLARLPENYQRIVTLRMEGFSIAAISDQVELTQRSVLRVLAHTRDLAAEILGNRD